MMLLLAFANIFQFNNPYQNVASSRHLFGAIKLWKTLLKIIITVAREKKVKWEGQQKKNVLRV